MFLTCTIGFTLMKVVLVCIWMKENERVKPLLCCLFEPLFQNNACKTKSIQSKNMDTWLRSARTSSSLSLKKHQNGQAKQPEDFVNSPAWGRIFSPNLRRHQLGFQYLAWRGWHLGDHIDPQEAIHNQWGWVEQLKPVPMGLSRFEIHLISEC